MEGLQIENKTDSSFYGFYKGNTIDIHTDEDNNKYYIIVSDNDGYILYDGYWKDSDEATIDEAIEEALDGSKLKVRTNK